MHEPSAIALNLLSIVLAVGGGVLAGVYFAFTAMVMPTLRDPEVNGTDHATAIVVMRRINEMALRPRFMLVFFGSAVVAGALILMAVLAMLSDERPVSFAFVAGPDPIGALAEATTLNAVLSIAGAALVLISGIITVAANMPLNAKLALERGEPDDDGTTGAPASYWPVYDRSWTRANSARAWCAAAGALVLVVSTFA